jgi:hypothetical protein
MPHTLLLGVQVIVKGWMRDAANDPSFAPPSQEA